MSVNLRQRKGIETERKREINGREKQGERESDVCVRVGETVA